MSQRLTIVSIPDRRYPTQQAFLEEVMAKLIPERGHRVIWIMQAENPTSNEQVLDWHKSEVIILKAKKRSSFFLKALNFVIRAIQLNKHLNLIINKEKPDIIQIRNDWVAGILAIKIRQKHGIPFSFQFSRPGSDFHFLSAKNAAFLSKLKLLLRGFVEKHTTQLIMRKANLIFPISEWMRKALVKQGIPEKKMYEFPLGFNTKISPDNINGGNIRSKYRIEDNPVIIYFGRMDKLRKLDFLIRCIRIVSNEIPDVRLLMVGGDENPKENKMLQLLTIDMGIRENVIFTGSVSRDQIPEYIASADIGVSPIPPYPIYQISSPTKLIETMGMAKPIIASDIPEQKQMIRKSKGGICVPYNEKLFAKAIIKILKSPDIANNMGREGRKYIENNRSYSQMAENLENIYLNLLENLSHN